MPDPEPLTVSVAQRRLLEAVARLRDSRDVADELGLDDPNDAVVIWLGSTAQVAMRDGKPTLARLYLALAELVLAVDADQARGQGVRG